MEDNNDPIERGGEFPCYSLTGARSPPGRHCGSHRHIRKTEPAWLDGCPGNGGGNFDQQIIEYLRRPAPLSKMSTTRPQKPMRSQWYRPAWLHSSHRSSSMGLDRPLPRSRLLPRTQQRRHLQTRGRRRYFTLDGNYDYSLSGFLSASGINSHATVFLYENTLGTIHYASMSDSTDLFSFDGTLSAGNYYMYGYSYSNQCCDGLTTGNADFELTFTLTPSTAVPEPSSMCLVGLGVLTAYRRLRRRSDGQRPVRSHSSQRFM